MTRVVVISPEPTPYRAPLFDRVGASDVLDLTVVYASQTVASRNWHVELDHHALFLHGVRLPGFRRILRHDYPITPGVWRALTNAAPDVVVVSGWSTFASQTAVVWCRLHGVPYVLLVESHDRGPRAGWRRAVKGAIVPRVVRSAAGVLTVGSLSRRSMVERGAPQDRIGVFANTIDVAHFGERADRLVGRRSELRAGFGIERDDVAVLCVARLAPEKGLDTLVRAVAAAGPHVSLLLVGNGVERKRLEQLVHSLGAATIFAGDLPWEQVVEAYVACDVFALLSLHEPWGVVVNEAAACRLPLVLSDRVGAGPDLLRGGENGYLVPANDMRAAAKALQALVASPSLRRKFGDRSREIVSSWGYEPSVASFVEIVQAAATDRRPRRRS